MRLIPGQFPLGTRGGEPRGRWHRFLAVLVMAIGLSLVVAQATLGLTMAQQAVTVCGTLNSLNQATAQNSGSINIGGQTFTIAPGTSITGLGIVGQSFTLSGQTNGSNQLTSGSLIATPQCATPSATPTALLGAPITVCGTVTNFAAATGSATGSLTINGETLTIGQGVNIGNPTSGQTYELTGTANGSTITSGALIQGTPCNAIPNTLTVVPGTSITICGVVTAFTAPTTNTSGSIVINGQTVTIAPGTSLPTPVIGEIATLTGTMGTLNTLTSGTLTLGGVCGNAFLTVTAIPSVSLPVGPINMCGTLGNLVTSSSTSPGQVTVNGQTIPIATGATIGTGTTGQTVQLSGTINSQGQLTTGTLTQVNACGAATAVASVTVAVPTVVVPTVVVPTVVVPTVVVPTVAVPAAPSVPAPAAPAAPVPAAPAPAAPIPAPPAVSNFPGATLPSGTIVNGVSVPAGPIEIVSVPGGTNLTPGTFTLPAGTVIRVPGQPGTITLTAPLPIQVAGVQAAAPAAQQAPRASAPVSAPVVAGVQGQPAAPAAQRTTLPTVAQLPSTGEPDPTPLAVVLAGMSGLGLWIRSKMRRR
ncbi:MAG: hypothetical protein QOF51_2243 [Chloroflexota bacterium]|nr:hypothetical protein [Chloroflexota bacterium]